MGEELRHGSQERAFADEQFFANGADGGQFQALLETARL